MATQAGRPVKFSQAWAATRRGLQGKARRECEGWIGVLDGAGYQDSQGGK